MAYNAEISRNNPTCFLFLIDQSGSMDDSFGGESGKKKAQGVSDAMNRLLQELVLRCAKEEGVRDYFFVGVIGYGVNVGPAFSGPLAGRELVPISEVGSTPARIEERTRKIDDGAGGLVEQKVRFPIWFDPVANGPTPMCQSLYLAQRILESWLVKHPDCYPPIVINITDGEATDGDPSIQAKSIRNLKSSDGEVLLFNLHLSSQRSKPILFPDNESELPDKFARLLFNMSSTLPIKMQSYAKNKGYTISNDSRGFVFNGDIISVIDFLEIGTQPGDLK